MFKLGFCVYGPQCRYRHTRVAGPPPEPKDIDCTRLRDLKRVCRDAMYAENRGRYVSVHVCHIIKLEA